MLMTLPDMKDKPRTALFIPHRRVVGQSLRRDIEQHFTLAVGWCAKQGYDTFICRGTEFLDCKFMSGVASYKARNHPGVRLLVYQFYEEELRDSVFKTVEGERLLSQVDFMTHVFCAPVTTARLIYAKEMIPRSSVVITAIPKYSPMNSVVVGQCREIGVPLYEAISGQVL